MSDVGKTNIVVMWTVAPEHVAEGDRVFESHVKWMTGMTPTQLRRGADADQLLALLVRRVIR